MSVSALSLSGNLFHKIGAADANARSPYVQVDEDGTTSKCLLEERKVSLGDIWSNDISQVSRGLMDYNFVAQKTRLGVWQYCIMVHTYTGLEMTLSA